MTDRNAATNLSQATGAPEARLIELAREKARLELVNTLLVKLSTVAGLDSMVDHILRILMETIGAANIALYYRIDANWHYRDIYGTALNTTELDQTAVARAIASGEPMSLAAGEAPYPADTASVAIQTWIYPLLARERRIGAVMMEGMQLTDEEIFQSLLPFFVYAGLMLDNEINNFSRLAEAHRKLQDSETIYRTLFEQSPDGIQLVDPADLRPVYFNSAIHRQLGYTREEYAQLTVADYEAIEDPDQIVGRVDSLRGTGSTTFVSRFRTKGGEIIHVYVSLQMVAISGTPHILAIVRDITPMKQTEVALRASEAKYRSLFNTIQDAVFLTDVSDNGRIIECNERLSGYSRAELIGKSTVELGLWGNLDERQQIIDSVREHGFVSDFETTFRRKDGTQFPGSISTNILSMEHKTYLLSVVRDITDRKHAEAERLNLERQLLHAQKLESLGVLAGGIAHDFNNILTAIIGNTDLALMRLAPESPVYDYLQRIESAAARAAELARQMLAYSGKGQFVIETIDLNRLVEEMGHMLEVSISKKAVLRYNLTRPLPSVNVDATQIRQIIMNLVINSSEAIGDRSGVIAISSGCMECTEEYLKDAWLADYLQAGHYVFLEVADTGCGMDTDTLAKLFDPFFTTKFTGRGLGMAAVLGIVRGHRGAIRVDSEPGRGATFRILLPGSGGPTHPAQIAPGSGYWQGSGVALLVDDEETVRSVGTEMLMRLGFRVITAADGREAVALFSGRSDINLVILDLTMPHMDGGECFRELKRLDPQVRVIMSSGFSEHEIAQRFSDQGVSGFIQKPYRLTELGRKVQEAFGRDHNPPRQPVQSG